MKHLQHIGQTEAAVWALIALLLIASMLAAYVFSLHVAP
jgi:hypothetical protein